MRRGLWWRFSGLRVSPLTRRIVVLNLAALVILFGVVLHLTPSRDAPALQRQMALAAQAELVADVIEVQLPARVPVSLASGDGIDLAGTLAGLDLGGGLEVLVFDASTVLIARRMVSAEPEEGQATSRVADMLEQVLDTLAAPMGEAGAPDEPPLAARLQPRIVSALETGPVAETVQTRDGPVVAAVTPILQEGRPIGAVAVTTAAPSGLSSGATFLHVLQIFAVAALISVGLSLVLASTIATPLRELAAAAEIGRDRSARQRRRGRVRIPDMTGRGDEIGRLSGALRGMISALYDRIDGNEQFAADVAHEIKNPLASLRSAVGTLRMVKRDDQRERLLEVIDHDVRRLDRLVSDISNASRLDSELVKETEVAFNVLETLTNLSQFLGEDARKKGIDFFTDFPEEPISVFGLEARLAQVFVNLISNAISFCEEGDAICVWARKRENRVLVVVEDTGPGIPEEALSKIFQRFYSHRPAEHFGNNSGLGLAISKQIVEAHGGVIWAENIRPTQADITSEPLGARFVVGLPI